MKTILFTLILTVTCLWGFSQSKISDLSEDTSIGGDEYLVEAASGSNYKILITTILDAAQDSVDITQGALEDTASDLRTYIDNAISAGEYWNYQPGYTPPTSVSRTLYPRRGLNYLNVWIGSAPPSGYNKYNLYIDGYTYLADTTWADVMMFGSTQVYDSINQLWFRDPTAGKYSLSGLLGLPTSLSATWDLSTTTYDWSIYSTGNQGLFWDYSEDLMTIVADARVDFDAPVVTMDSLYSTDIGTTEITTDAITLDGETIDNWDDVGGGGGLGGVYVDGSKTGVDTVWMPVIVNVAGPSGTSSDTVDYVAVVYDTLSSDLFCASVNITSGNIADGDAVTLVAAQGAGTLIIPLKMVTLYDYDDANTYTSGDATYSAALEYADGTWTQIAVLDDCFEASADYLEQDTPVGSAVADSYNDMNTALVLDFFTHSGSGTGTAKVKVYFTIADFN